MYDDGAFDSESGEPLDPWLGDESPATDLAGARQQRFELTSRGDRVPGRLLLPASGGAPHPLVLLQHGLGGSKEAPYVLAAAGPWVRAGAAVAAIDFPLHGERASAKVERIASHDGQRLRQVPEREGGSPQAIPERNGDSRYLS